MCEGVVERCSRRERVLGSFFPFLSFFIFSFFSFFIFSFFPFFEERKMSADDLINAIDYGNKKKALRLLNEEHVDVDGRDCFVSISFLSFLDDLALVE